MTFQITIHIRFLSPGGEDYIHHFEGVNYTLPKEGIDLTS